MRASLGEVGQVLVGEVDHPLLHVLLGQLDEVVGHGVADPAAARVQHDPDLVGLVQADLDEMVATAERWHHIKAPRSEQRASTLNGEAFIVLMLGKRSNP